MSWAEAGRHVEALIERGDRAASCHDGQQAQVEYTVAALTAFMEREAAPPGALRRRYHGLMLFANARLPPEMRAGEEYPA